jgi:release factor glutamine methyltransferase
VKISVREALARGAGRLHAAGIESARLDARLLLCRAMEISSDQLFSAEARGDQLEKFETLVARRAAHEPIAYITGLKEFWSLDFEVGPGVLIPRPETETLVEEALRIFSEAEAPLHVMDVGAGSGCLLTAFLKERRNATGLGIDNSEAALVYARRNAQRHGLGARCIFELLDASHAPQGGGGTRGRGEAGFDVIFANPPYLTDREFEGSAAEICDHEPRQAFAGGPDGLEAIRAFAPMFARSLVAAGAGFLEIGAGQAARVSEIIRDAGLEVRHEIYDLSGIPRCLVIGRVGIGQPLAPRKKSVGKGPATR